jgi:hypothetical protein
LNARSVENSEPLAFEQGDKNEFVKKIAQNVAQGMFVSKLMHKPNLEKVSSQK